MEQRCFAILLLMACLSWMLYVVIALGGQSLHEEGSGGHSLLTILALFAAAFACYLVAIWAAIRAHQDNRLVGLIVAATVIFRATMLFSDPIEEIDLYRYLWDGAAASQGVNPFRYTPDQVLAPDHNQSLPADLARLVALRDGSPAMAEILGRVHYPELPTIYPPVSQAGFLLATWSTPSTASVTARMTIIKTWFVGFDLATLFVVISLLRLTGRHLGWTVAYAWCPLLLKEIANSGHVDALAMFLSALAAFVAMRALYATRHADDSDPQHTRRATLGSIFAALVLALAVGAKLYPIVLAPLLLVMIARRLSWRVALISAGVFLLAAAVLLWPMWPANRQTSPSPPREAFDAGLPPLPPEVLNLRAADPSQGLKAFLSRWEMNDFLFLLVMENLRPTADLPRHEVAWFSVVPERWREVLVGHLGSLGVSAGHAPFLLSRVLTSLAFLAIAAWLAVRAARNNSAANWLNAAFLTLAWFWLLLPTQNPWYWTWTLPFIVFARCRSWLAISGLAFVYYFRFWLAFHFSDRFVPGTHYSGPLFFDYVITWLEFAPFFFCLAVESFMRRRRDPDKRLPERSTLA